MNTRIEALPRTGLRLAVDLALADDGARLFYRALGPALPRARILLAHGAGVHSEYYMPQALALAGHGFSVVLPDLRGHGRSDGAPGHVDDYRRWVRDLLGLGRELAGRGPVVLAGESLGGLLAFLAALEADWARGLVLASPAFRLMYRPGRVERAWLGIGAWWPRLLMPATFSFEGVTRHAAGIDMANRDPMVRRRYSLGYARQVLAAEAEARRRAGELRLPTLAILAGREHVTDVGAAQKVLAEARAPVTVHEVPDFRHAVLMEDPDLTAGLIARWYAGLETPAEPKG